MEGLAGKSAIITGACSDIGRAICDRLLAEGMSLALADLDVDNVEALARELGEGVIACAGDLSEQATVVSLVDQTHKAFGRVDVLVNNAGGGVIRPFLDHDLESFTATLNRNLWTALWCCHSVLPHMVEAGWGRIINIGADSVRNGLWDHAAYNAAKGGVHGLTTGLAREFATTGVTINTVAPCMIATQPVKDAMAAGLEIVDKFTGVIPMGRPGECEEVASMVAYLAAPEAGFVTGQTISVNGGSTML
ncbi:MAG: SDR family oxidoreductase [Pseudomonadota bacterium]|jgi:2,3-dihydroxy-2,3-dihydro-p-cumate dehydrogenase